MAASSEADRSHALRTLKALESELRAQGVRHVSVFGSVARGEGTPSSDIDLALDLVPGAAPPGFQFVTYVDRLPEGDRQDRAGGRFLMLNRARPVMDIRATR